MTDATPVRSACSLDWDLAELPAWGSAAGSAFVVGLEQPGPWGREAAVESRLDPEVGRELSDACANAGGRLLLMRDPSGYRERSGQSHRVLVAGGRPESRWLLEGEVDDPVELLRLPWWQLREDDPDAVTEAVPTLEETREPALLVCTNGKRDACCASRSRPVVMAAAAERPGRVWECSHTGGHRFAPTGLTLPSGQTWGRLGGDLAVRAIDAEGRGEIDPALLGRRHDRGRATAPDAECQVAETWVREQTDDRALGGLHSEHDGPVVRVTHRDGRSWEVAVGREPGPELRDSCVKAPSADLGQCSWWPSGPSSECSGSRR